MSEAGRDRAIAPSQLPLRILEVGAGDGYFLKGLQSIFPDAHYHCLDVVDEILKATEVVHGFKSIHARLEDFEVQNEAEKFDLIIARDILEHVDNPALVIGRLKSAMRPGGLLYILTPNGRQDSWQLQTRFEHDGEPGELLINHVNYFDPVSLQIHLQRQGFRLREYYTFNFKQTLKGAGWRKLAQHMSPPSQKRSADSMIAKTPALSDSFENALRSMPERFASSISEHSRPRPFWAKAARLLYGAWALYRHHPLLRAPAGARLGEEIWCLAELR